MKEQTRIKYKKIRKEIQNKTVKDNSIYQKLLDNEDFNNASEIFIYVSKTDEVDTLNIIKKYLNIKKIAVPKVIGEEIKFYYIKSFNDLTLGKYNILEPITNEEAFPTKETIIIVPGICFDKRRYRIGYGRGYYDKYLSQNNILSIGLCYKECYLEKIEPDIYDQKVNKIITD